MQKHRNFFFEIELAHDSVIFTMKRIICPFNVCVGAMPLPEQTAIVMEQVSTSASWRTCVISTAKLLLNPKPQNPKRHDST